MTDNATTARHIRLWHKDFWKISAVNLFTALSVYMLLPVLPLWLSSRLSMSPLQVAIAMAAPGVGVFLFGSMCSFLVQKYRRNKVCITAMALLAATIVAITYVADSATLIEELQLTFASVLVLRLLTGAFFGLAYLVLNSTLVVDCCETAERTLANIVSAWCYRLAMVGGPLIGLLLWHEVGAQNVFYVSAALCLVSAATLWSVNFPFKAPEETVRTFSFDRFLLPSSMALSVPVAVVSASLVLVMLSPLTVANSVFLIIGLLAAIPVQHIALNGVGRGWRVFGAAALLIASAVLSFFGGNVILAATARIIFAFAAALIVCNLHYALTETADHCQRGTAQSTFVLFSEFGVAVGVLLYLIPLTSTATDIAEVVLALSILAALCLALFTKRFIARKVKD